MNPLELLVGPIERLLDKVIPDADERLKLANEIATLATRQAHENAMAQIEVNKAAAQSGSMFVAGARPFIMWVCGVALANNYVIAPYVSAFTTTELPVLNMGELMPVLLGLLGLGGMRSWEKGQGVARNKL